MWGEKSGGVTRTQAGCARSGSPPFRKVTLAWTGPSDTSSYQKSLLAKWTTGLSGRVVPEWPKPPRTSSRPSSSVRSSPSGTGRPRNVPVSNRPPGPDRPGPVTVRGPGLTASRERASGSSTSTAWLRRALGSRAPPPSVPSWCRPTNLNQAALVLASSTVQEISACSAVSSPSTVPSAA